MSIAWHDSFFLPHCCKKTIVSQLNPAAHSLPVEKRTLGPDDLNSSTSLNATFSPSGEQVVRLHLVDCYLSIHTGQNAAKRRERKVSDVLIDNEEGVDGSAQMKRGERQEEERGRGYRMAMIASTTSSGPQRRCCFRVVSGEAAQFSKISQLRIISSSINKSTISHVYFHPTEESKLVCMHGSEMNISSPICCGVLENPICTLYIYLENHQHFTLTRTVAD